MNLDAVQSAFLVALYKVRFVEYASHLRWDDWPQENDFEPEAVRRAFYFL